jgi:hypothetical protein
VFHSVGGRARLTASWQLKAELETPAILAQNNRKPLSLETGARFRAELSHGADKGGAGQAALRLSKIKSDWVDLNALAFSVSIDEGPVVTMRKTGGRLPFALSAALNLATGEASLKFNAKNTPVAPHITLKGPLRPYSRWIPESLDGNLAVTVQTKDLSGKSGMAMLSGAAPVFEANLRGVFQRQSPLGRSSFIVRGEGDAEHARAAELSLSMPQGRLSFNGSVGYRGLDINGRVLVDSFALRAGHPLSGRFLIDTINRTTSLFAETVDISGVELAAVLLVISRETESADFSFSALRFSETGINNETGFSEVNIGRMSGYGFWNWKQNNLDVNFAMDEMIASDLYRMGEAAAAIPELPPALMEEIEKTKFTADAYLSTDFKSLTYNIPTFVAAYRGGGGAAEKTTTAILSISGTESYLTMNEASIITPEGTITASADFEFEDKDDISFRMECTYQDLV